LNNCVYDICNDRDNNSNKENSSAVANPTFRCIKIVERIAPGASSMDTNQLKPTTGDKLATKNESGGQPVLALLLPQQHLVTRAPKFITELPFFYLTKQKRLLNQTIKYQGLDNAGRPIHWEVIPNTKPEI
jgi:hypothetical protein